MMSVIWRTSLAWCHPRMWKSRASSRRKEKWSCLTKIRRSPKLPKCQGGGEKRCWIYKISSPFTWWSDAGQTPAWVEGAGGRGEEQRRGWEKQTMRFSISPSGWAEQARHYCRSLPPWSWWPSLHPKATQTKCARGLNHILISNKLICIFSSTMDGHTLKTRTPGILRLTHRLCMRWRFGEESNNAVLYLIFVQGYENFYDEALKKRVICPKFYSCVPWKDRWSILVGFTRDSFTEDVKCCSYEKFKPFQRGSTSAAGMAGADGGDWITLNVGGQKFLTSRYFQLSSLRYTCI